MFGFIGSLAKAAIGVVLTPVAVVADVVSKTGLIEEPETSYTEETVKSVFENVTDALDPTK